MIYGSIALYFIRNKKIPLVQKQNTKLFTICESHGCSTIVQYVFPRSEQGPFANCAAREPPGGRLDDLQVKGGGGADAFHLGQPFRAGADYFSERTKAADQRLRERFDVSLGDRAKENQLQKLVIRHALIARFREPLAKANAVPLVMRLRFGCPLNFWLSFSLKLRRGLPVGKPPRPLHLIDCPGV